MNSIWNNNLAFFKKRFPRLTELYKDLITDITEKCDFFVDGQFDGDVFSKLNRQLKVGDEVATMDRLFRAGDETDIADRLFGGVWEISKAKNGEVTAIENGVRLHSVYNPSREAEQAISSSFEDFDRQIRASGFISLDRQSGASDVISLGKQSDVSGVSSLDRQFGAVPYAIFCGFGLGYIVTEFAKKFPNGAILAIEPDPVHFFLVMTLIDWIPVFQVEKCIIALACPIEQIIPLSESFGISLDKAKVFYNPAFMKHDEDYFSAVKKLINRNLSKINLNENTKKKFGKLWERNARLNLKWAEKCDGVKIYKDAAKKISLSASDRTSFDNLNPSFDRQFGDGKVSVSDDICFDSVPPFLLIAAGPSLEKMLPRLPELKSKMITVCVDTALKAVLRAGVEPDFIVLTDPQFWAYLHIAGLESPSSVLICDAVSYPAVFRFHCKKIVISSSPFPLPDEYKDIYAEKGDLGSGGSVATVAWNFCEYCGAKEIYTIGLDLSFPKKQPHIKGSTFEQSVHAISKRTATAEKRTADVLFGADISKAVDYNGNEVLTDSRMKMFAWWFESRIAACPHVKTYTLCAESMVIPGIVLRASE